VELTPRTLDDDDVTLEEGEVPAERRPRTRRTRRRWLPLAVLGAVLLGIGLLTYKGLSDATLYFRNADEAVAQRDELGGRRFRLQGTVVGDPVVDDDLVSFDVAYNGVSVAVAHTGTPPDMFRPGVPVVVEGHWRDGDEVFDSDRMLIKHDASYESRDDYDERIDDAEDGGQSATTSAGTDEGAGQGEGAG
jgi:cytochrome c-type biogenesis protein CcmE